MFAIYLGQITFYLRQTFRKTAVKTRKPVESLPDNLSGPLYITAFLRRYVIHHKQHRHQ